MCWEKRADGFLAQRVPDSPHGFDVVFGFIGIYFLFETVDGDIDGAVLVHFIPSPDVFEEVFAVKNDILVAHKGIKQIKFKFRELDGTIVDEESARCEIEGDVTVGDIPLVWSFLGAA